MPVAIAQKSQPEALPSPSTRRLGSDWVRLFSAGTVSMIGDGMRIAVLPLFAALLTTDPRQVAAVAAAAGLPWLLLSLPAGSLADRWDRRRLMIGAQTAQMVIISAAGALALAGQAQIWSLCLAAFGMGAAETVFQSASEAVLPALVDEKHLVVANGRQQASIFIGEQSIGPPLGAALFAAAAFLPLWLDAFSFAVSIVLIVAIRPRPGFRPRIARQSPLRDVAEGMRFLRRHVVIRTLTGMAAVANFTTFMAMSTMVLFVTEVVGLDDREYGLLLGAAAIGGALGAVISAAVVKRVGLRATLLVVPFIAPVAFVLVGFVGGAPVFIAVMLAASTLALALWNVVSFTLRQLLVPSELLGRVGGAAKMIAFGAGPLGSLAGGFVAAHWGLAAPWIVAGVLRLMLSLVMVPILRGQRITSPMDRAPRIVGRHRADSQRRGAHRSDA